MVGLDGDFHPMGIQIRKKSPEKQIQVLHNTPEN